MINLITSPSFIRISQIFLVLPRLSLLWKYLLDWVGTSSTSELGNYRTKIVDSSDFNETYERFVITEEKYYCYNLTKSWFFFAFFREKQLVIYHHTSSSSLYCLILTERCWCIYCEATYIYIMKTFYFLCLEIDLRVRYMNSGEWE